MTLLHIFISSFQIPLKSIGLPFFDVLFVVFTIRLKSDLQKLGAAVCHPVEV